MVSRVVYLLILLLSFFMSYAQSPELIDGRVRGVNGEDVKVQIENGRSGKKVNSDSTGFFSIVVEEGDILNFSASGLEPKIYIINKTDLENGSISVYLSRPNESLEEIVISKKLFADGAFGEGIKTYTPAQRKYRSASTSLFRITEGEPTKIGLDPIFNILNGKKKRLKKAMLYEAQELASDTFYEYYSKEDLISKFNIPEDHVMSFVYFVVLQEDYKQVNLERSTKYDLFLAVLYERYLSFL